MITFKKYLKEAIESNRFQQRMGAVRRLRQSDHPTVKEFGQHYRDENWRHAVNLYNSTDDHTRGRIDNILRFHSYKMGGADPEGTSYKHAQLHHDLYNEFHGHVHRLSKVDNPANVVQEPGHKSPRDRD